MVLEPFEECGGDLVFVVVPCGVSCAESVAVFVVLEVCGHIIVKGSLEEKLPSYGQ